MTLSNNERQKRYREKRTAYLRDLEQRIARLEELVTPLEHGR